MIVFIPVRALRAKLICRLMITLSVCGGGHLNHLPYGFDVARGCGYL
jgi:hypothetical protein